MLILPAIDIIGGNCVRLYQGDYSQLHEYDEDPYECARGFINDGAKFLHIVDLEGAKEGRPVNFEIALKIAQKLNVDVQLGGGVRTRDNVRILLDNGIRRVILGSSAVADPEMAGELIRKYGSDRMIVSVDVRDGQICVAGWSKKSGKSVDRVLCKLREVGVKMIVFTDISRDGAMKGVNFENVSSVLGCGFDVIVAGGVCGADDVRRLREMGAYGAIIGKALYEGKVDLAECLMVAKEGQASGQNSVENYLSKRIIPCMDVKNGRVVKGVNFKGFRDAGDPVELGRQYSEMGADELVFLDIMATVEKRDTLYMLVERIAENIDIPFTVGGGVKSVADIRKLLNAGADKAGIESAAVRNPELVRKAAKAFGSQCIVVSMAPKRVGKSWELFVRGGRTETGVDAIEFAKKMVEVGAGELLVNSLDRDGTKKGYDIPLLKAINDAVNIPVIASSGAGKKEDFLDAFKEGGADAALAASLFHYEKLSISEIKKYLSENNINVRL